MEGVKYDSFAVTNEFLTTMEPATMRPHQATRTKNVEFSATFPGQGRTERVDGRTAELSLHLLRWGRACFPQFGPVWGQVSGLSPKPPKLWKTGPSPCSSAYGLPILMRHVSPDRRSMPDAPGGRLRLGARRGAREGSDGLPAWRRARPSIGADSTITFALPPAGWRREGETGGGIKGARFVKTGSVGEGIGLGDYYLLANRHRSAYLRDMIAKFETYDSGFDWDKALRGAYAYTDSPFTPLETEIAERINTEVGAGGHGVSATGTRTPRSAHLETALREADRLHFSLGDVIGRVEFKPERRQEPEYYQMLGRREATIAGEPAVIVDYTVKVPERQRTYSAREAYFVHNSHLFICHVHRPERDARRVRRRPRQHRVPEVSRPVARPRWCALLQFWSNAASERR